MTKRMRGPTQFLTVKRKTWQTQIASTTTGVGGSNAFALSGITSYGDFANVFDMYRINAVRLDFYPRINDVAVSGNTQCPFHYVVDITDVTAPSYPTDILKYGNAKTVQALKPFHIYLKPRAAQPVWQGLSANGYAPAKQGTWVDTKSPGVQHYGVKWFFDTAATGFTMDVMCTYYLQFKGVNA